MARGGLRSGAGRRPTLDLLEQLEVGAECERRWADARAAAENRAEEKLRLNEEYNRLIRDAQAVPIGDRLSWLRSFAGMDHLDDVEGARREAAPDIDPMSNEVPSRLKSVQVVRPYRAWAQIEFHVSQWASERFQRIVSVRMVRTYRTTLKQMRSRLSKG